MTVGGLRVRAARPVEAPELSELALRSKGHWGYDADFLEACRAELTFRTADCDGHGFWVAEEAGAVLGLVRLVAPTSLLRETEQGRSGNETACAVGELADLFVDPPAIGRGVGRLLLAHALEAAQERGWAAVELDADPDAQSFYERHGAHVVGRSPSGSIPGRTLPRMRFDLS